MPGARRHRGRRRRARSATPARAQPAPRDRLRLLMQALAARGNVAEALRVYERARTVLRDELGIPPRIMIPLCFGSTAPFEGARHERGHIWRTAPVCRARQQRDRGASRELEDPSRRIGETRGHLGRRARDHATRRVASELGSLPAFAVDRRFSWSPRSEQEPGLLLSRRCSLRLGDLSRPGYARSFARHRPRLLRYSSGSRNRVLDRAGLPAPAGRSLAAVYDVRRRSVTAPSASDSDGDGEDADVNRQLRDHSV